MDREPSTRVEAIKKAEAVILFMKQINANFFEDAYPDPNSTESKEEQQRALLEKFDSLNTIENLHRVVIDQLVVQAKDDEEFIALCERAGNSFYAVLFAGLYCNSKFDLETAKKYYSEGAYLHFVKKGEESYAKAAEIYAAMTGIIKAEEIEKKFEHLNNLPPTIKDSLLEVYWANATQLGDDIDQTLAEISRKFLENDKGKLLQRHFELATWCLSSKDKTSANGFPPLSLLDAEKTFEEFLYLEDEVYDNGFDKIAVEMAKLYMYWNPDFRGSEREEGPNIKLIISSLRKDFKDQEKLKNNLFKVLKGRLNFPMRLAVIGKMKIIEDKFPGGIDAFLEFFAETQDYFVFNPGMGVVITESLADEQIPSEKAAPLYYEEGKKVLKHLREDAEPYFNYKHFSVELKDALENNPEEFENAMLQAREFIFSSSMTGSRLDKTAEAVLQLYLMYYGRDGFEEFLDGLAILLKDWRSCIKKIRNIKGVKSEDVEAAFQKFRLVLIIFLSMCKENESNNFKSSKDFKMAAYITGMISFDHLPFAIAGENVIDMIPEKMDESSDEIFARTIFKERDLTGTQKLHDLMKGFLNFDDKKLREAMDVLDSPNLRLEDPYISFLIEKIGKEARSTLRTGEWKNNLGFRNKREKSGNILVKEGDIVKDSWVNRANCGTQLAATSGAMILALGLEQTFMVPEIAGQIPSGLLEKIPLDEELVKLANGEMEIKELVNVIEKKGFGKILRSNIQRALPFVAQAIQDRRLTLPGLMSVGTKIESPKSMNADDVEFALELAAMGDAKSTPFVLKHNNRSLVCPPLPSALEERLLHAFFILFGAVDSNQVDLQITMGGRLSNKTASIVGASSILASYAAVKYAPGAFESTWHRLEGNRLFCFDAGVRRNSLPFDVKGAIGRTDRVGAKSVFDIELIQLLGTFAVHREFNGNFHEGFDTYKSNFEKLLEAHGLLDNLHISNWAVGQDTHLTDNFDNTQFHEEMVESFCAARRENPVLKEGVRSLILKDIVGNLQGQRKKILEEMKEEVEKLKEY